MKAQLARGVLWLSAAKVAVTVLALCSTFILARLLTPEDFGLVALALTMLEVLAAITELSLASSLIHHERPTEDHFHTAWTMNLIRGGLVGAGFALASPWVADLYHDERLIPVMCWMGLSVFINGGANPKVIVLTRQLVFWQEFVVLVTQKLAGVVASIVVALVFRSHWALVVGLLCTQVAGVVSSYVVVPYRPRFSLIHVRDLLSFSVWLSLGQIVNTLNWRLDHLIIGARMGARALGLYTVGDKLAALATRETIGPIEQALFPGLRAVVHEPERLKRGYLRAQAVIAAAAMPVGMLFALQAEVVVRLVLGEKWLDAVIVVQMLAAVFALQTVASPVRPLAMALGATRLLFMRDLAMFAVRVPIIAAAAWYGGLLMVLQARAITGLATIVLNMTVVRQLAGLSLTAQLRSTERSLVSAVVAGAVVWAAQTPSGAGWSWLHLAGELAAVSTLGVAVYGAMHLVLWSLASRPPGPETELLSLLDKLRHKFLPHQVSTHDQ